MYYKDEIQKKPFSVARLPSVYATGVAKSAGQENISGVFIGE